MRKFRSGQLAIAGSLNAITGSLDIVRKYKFAHESARFTAEWVFDESMEVDIDTYKRIIPGNICALGMHGISNQTRDSAHLSHPNKDLREHARKRYLQCVDVASRLNASHIVFHQWYAPLRVEGFTEDRWMIQADYWPEIGAEAEKRGVVIVLENDHTPTPDHVIHLLEKINHPNVQAHLDIAHAFVNSKVPISDWIHVLSERLRCLHINNTDGEKDRHWPLPKGVIDYRTVFNDLEHIWDQLIMITIETDPNDRTGFMESIRYLQSLNML